jgi:hypothetical protein
METRHLCLILTGPSFAVYVLYRDKKSGHCRWMQIMVLVSSCLYLCFHVLTSLLLVLKMLFIKIHTIFSMIC